MHKGLCMPGDNVVDDLHDGFYWLRDLLSSWGCSQEQIDSAVDKFTSDMACYVLSAPAQIDKRKKGRGRDA